MRRVAPAPREAACSHCGATGLDAGPFWESFYRVLDFGVPGMVFEPDDLHLLVLCDACEGRRLTGEG